MKFKIVYCLTFLSYFSLLGQDSKQEVIADSLIVNKIYDANIIYSEKESNWTYLMMGKDTIYAHLMNNNIQSISSLKFPKKKEPFGLLKGGFIRSNQATLFFLDKVYKDKIRGSRESKLLTMRIDFDNSTFHLKEQKYLNDDDYVLHASSHNDKFYVVTLRKKSSQLKVTIFDSDTSFTSKMVFLDHIDFKKSESKTSLFDILLKGTSVNEPYFIDKSLQPTLARSSPKNKIYIENDHLYLTLDNETEMTKIVSLSLIDFKSSINHYSTEELKCGKYARDNKYQTNSYLLNNKLYQVKACTNGILLSQHDLESKISKTYKTHYGSEITFKNIPIVESSGDWIYGRGKSEVIDTKTAFYWFYKSKLSLYATEYQDTVTVTTGSYKEEIQGSIPIAGGMIGGAFAFFSIDVVDNPRQVTYFKSLFDKEYNHVRGEYKEKGVFYEMLDFIDNENEKASVSFGQVIPFYKTISLPNFYVLSYYNKKEKKLYLKRFDNQYVTDDGREKL